MMTPEQIEDMAAAFSDLVKDHGIDLLLSCLSLMGIPATHLDDGKDDLILRVGPADFITIHPDASYELRIGEVPIDEQ